MFPMLIIELKENSFQISTHTNLGSAFAKILVGIEDQSKDKNLLIKHLGKSGTIFIEETSNKAYKNFLK